MVALVAAVVVVAGAFVAVRTLTNGADRPSASGAIGPEGGTVTGAGATVLFPPGSVSGTGRVDVKQVPPPGQAPESTELGPAVDIALSGAEMIGEVVISIAVPPDIDGATLLGVTWDSGEGAWVAELTEFDSTTRQLRITASHLSTWSWIRIDGAKLGGRILDGIKNLVTGRAGAPQPTCPDESGAKAGGVSVTSSSGDLVKWCLGLQSGRRMLTVTNNRAAAALNTFPQAWSVGDVRGSGLSFEALGRWLDTKAPAPRGMRSSVVGRGDAIDLQLQDPPNGTLTAEMSSLTWAFSNLDVVVDVLVAVIGVFVKEVKNAGQAIIAGALTAGEGVDSLAFVQCFNATYGADIDPRQPMAGVPDAFGAVVKAARFGLSCGMDLIKEFASARGVGRIGKVALTVLGAAVGFVLSGAVNVFAAARNLWDMAFGDDRYAVTLKSALAPATAACPPGRECLDDVAIDLDGDGAPDRLALWIDASAGRVMGTGKTATGETSTTLVATVSGIRGQDPSRRSILTGTKNLDGRPGDEALVFVTLGDVGHYTLLTWGSGQLVNLVSSGSSLGLASGGYGGSDSQTSMFSEQLGFYCVRQSIGDYLIVSWSSSFKRAGGVSTYAIREKAYVIDSKQLVAQPSEDRTAEASSLPYALRTTDSGCVGSDVSRPVLR
jgi:hypothetical protein